MNDEADTHFDLYGPPFAEAVSIERAPRLDSWMAQDHPDQQRLREYLDWLEGRLREHLAPAGNALELVVGLPGYDAAHTTGHDLDNYLFPVVRRLGHQRFVSAWAAKVARGDSTIAVGPALRAEPLDRSWAFLSLSTNAPAGGRAWKADVARQVRAQAAEPTRGAVELQISYVIDPRWNWAQLWKPTIDALGPLLGEGPRPFDPLDDRVIRLGLHRRLERAPNRRTAIGKWGAGGALVPQQGRFRARARPSLGARHAR